MILLAGKGKGVWPRYLRGDSPWGMKSPILSSPFVMTALTLVFAVLGAVIGWALSAPVYMLLGPAVAVSVVTARSAACSASCG